MEKIHNIDYSQLEVLIEKSVKAAFSQISVVQPVNVPELLTVSQAADFLSLSPSTVYTYISRRTIPFVKRNGSVWLLRSKLMVWLEEGEKETLTHAARS
ncbi:helix-turn-helix domain-containing protein [Dyadobacter chenhuakuii]|uniref:Helix-turn-helix domain-containing protein n=1 Tax=Dyadobacter chenhuakuii TaxID=2909339 RepID=A0A9X1TX25_9BACT|nr:helix-turn-helix domain-containing protein [Dyadobacter chenhuakuii]MCF2501697.1 helix-turn-helix domain-containing protein [Dyadobacter chenhuakuii]